VHIVILAGGNGTRLWPAAKAAKAKPFIRIYNNQTLLYCSFMRALSINGMQTITVVTTENLLTDVIAEYGKIALPKPKLTTIIEPSVKNTAPAIAVAAAWLQRVHGPDAPLLIMPSDHLIIDSEAFAQAVSSINGHLLANNIILFGVEATNPDSNYGYIEHERQRVINFIEKPNSCDARKYLEQKNRFLWNCGIICSKASVLLASIKRIAAYFIKDIQSLLESSDAFNFSSNIEILRLHAASWGKLDSESIDYFLLEKADNLAIIRGQFDWADVGNWHSFSKIFAHNTDIDGNLLSDNSFALASHNCYINSSGKVIAAVGVSNLIIVENETGILVLDKNHAALVKELWPLVTGESEH